MELDNEKVRSEKLYSVGFSKELDSYVMSIVVPWVAWYNGYYRITKEEYEAFSTDELDELAERFRREECSSDRFLKSDKVEENR